MQAGAGPFSASWGCANAARCQGPNSFRTDRFSSPITKNSCVRAIGRGFSVAAQLAYQRLDLLLPVAVVGFAQSARSQLIDHHDESADLIEHLPAVSFAPAAQAPGHPPLFPFPDPTAIC